MSKMTDEELAGLSYAKAAEGHNDPNYHRDLIDQAKDIKKLKASVSSVQVIDGYDPHVRVRAGTDIGAIKETAQIIGRLSDAPVVDNTGYRAPNGLRQPPAHSFYKEDRIDTEDDLALDRARKRRGA